MYDLCAFAGQLIQPTPECASLSHAKAFCTLSLRRSFLQSFKMAKSAAPAKKTAKAAKAAGGKKKATRRTEVS